jgi:hypothetical protein
MIVVGIVVLAVIRTVPADGRVTAGVKVAVP